MLLRPIVPRPMVPRLYHKPMVPRPYLYVTQAYGAQALPICYSGLWCPGLTYMLLRPIVPRPMVPRLYHKPMVPRPYLYVTQAYGAQALPICYSGLWCPGLTYMLLRPIVPRPMVPRLYHKPMVPRPYLYVTQAYGVQA